MTRINRLIFNSALALIVTATLSSPLKADQNSMVQVEQWVTNAIQWDSIWGSDVTCLTNGLPLSKQLASSTGHLFSMETVQKPDSIVAMVPELHRIVSIRLTPDRRLASIRIETNCETDLRNYESKLRALRKSPAQVHYPRLQKHLQEMREAAPAAPDQQTPIVSTGKLLIAVPKQMVVTGKREWSHTKLDALRSVEAAAQQSFVEACTPGSRGVALIPDFRVQDPALLTVIKSKELTCVLPIGFQHRDKLGRSVCGIRDPHVRRRSCVGSKG